MPSNITEGRGIVYRLVCRPNGREYIGSFLTESDDSIEILLGSRKVYHAMNAVQGKHKNDLNEDIRSYGIGSFDIELLEELDDCDTGLLNSNEREFIYETAGRIGNFMYNKVAKSKIPEELPSYEYEYIQGDYEESLKLNDICSKNLYVLTHEYGGRSYLSGYDEMKNYKKNNPDNYFVRIVKPDDLFKFVQGCSSYELDDTLDKFRKIF